MLVLIDMLGFLNAVLNSMTREVMMSFEHVYDTFSAIFFWIGSSFELHWITKWTVSFFELRLTWKTLSLLWNVICPWVEFKLVLSVSQIDNSGVAKWIRTKHRKVFMFLISKLFGVNECRLDENWFVCRKIWKMRTSKEYWRTQWEKMLVESGTFGDKVLFGE